MNALEHPTTAPLEVRAHELGGALEAHLARSLRAHGCVTRCSSCDGCARATCATCCLCGRALYLELRGVAS